MQRKNYKSKWFHTYVAREYNKLHYVSSFEPFEHKNINDLKILEQQHSKTRTQVQSAVSSMRINNDRYGFSVCQTFDDLSTSMNILELLKRQDVFSTRSTHRLMRCLTKCVETQNWKRFDLVLSTVNSLLSEHKDFPSCLERIDGVEILLSILLCLDDNGNNDNEKRIVSLTSCFQHLNTTDTELRMLEHMIARHARSDAVMQIFTRTIRSNYFQCEMWTNVTSNLALTNLLQSFEKQKSVIDDSITMRWLLYLVQFRNKSISESLAESALSLFVRLKDESLLSSIAGFVVKSLSSERIKL